MNFETLQKQIKWADTVGQKIFNAEKVEKLIEKIQKGKGTFDFAQNDNFPLGIIFDFYGKKEKSFCVVNEELKERLLKMCQ